MRKQSRKKFDIELLEKLLNNEKSCLEKIRTTHHLALHPFHLNDVTNSVKDLLNKNVGKFNRDLDGILFGYHNIQLMSNFGNILGDSCFIHIDIEADFYIFKPIIGNSLTGIVNKESKDHVGCLVHKTFNVSLPKDEKDWLGEEIQLNSEVEFIITSTNFDGSLPYIRGKLISIISEPNGEDDQQQTSKNISKKKKKKSKITKFLDEDEPSTIPKLLEKNNDETPPSKRKQKKKKTGSEAWDGLSDEQPVKKRRSSGTLLSDDELLESKPFLLNNEEQLSPKKKKKKSKIDTELQEKVEDPDVVLKSSDSISGDGWKKKRKLSLDEEYEISPKKKKSKKSIVEDSIINDSPKKKIKKEKYT